MNTEPQGAIQDVPKKNPPHGESSANVPLIRGFMEKNGHRYRQLQIDEIHGKKVNISILVPLRELQGDDKAGNEKWYTDSVRHALEINDSIFKTIPTEKTYLFVETTEDWNAYAGENSVRRKTKGDRYHGGAGEDILCFTPPGMRNETNADLGEGSAADYVRMVLDHETAHAAIQSKYGENTRRIPQWLSEAVPMLVCTDLSKPVSQKLALRMYGFFSEYPMPPSDTILSTYRYEGREDRAPVMYTYGEQFFKWLVNLQSGSSDLIKKAMVVPLLDRLTTQYKGDFQTAFRETFGLNYDQAYAGFLTYLKAAAKVQEDGNLHDSLSESTAEK